MINHLWMGLGALGLLLLSLCMFWLSREADTHLRDSFNRAQIAESEFLADPRGTHGKANNGPTIGVEL